MPPTFDEWSELTDGYDVPVIAALCKVHAGTVKRWKVRGAPFMAMKFLRAELHGELPGDAWSGWRVREGLLYPPDMRHGFTPGDVRALFWWHQVRAWREAHLRKSWSTRPAQAGQHTA